MLSLGYLLVVLEIGKAEEDATAQQALERSLFPCEQCCRDDDLILYELNREYFDQKQGESADKCSSWIRIRAVSVNRSPLPRSFQCICLCFQA